VITDSFGTAKPYPVKRQTIAKMYQQGAKLYFTLIHCTVLTQAPMVESCFVPFISYHQQDSIHG
jgi:hypothetical protein